MSQNRTNDVVAVKVTRKTAQLLCLPPEMPNVVGQVEGPRFKLRLVLNESEEDGYGVAPHPAHSGERGDGEEEGGVLQQRQAEGDGDGTRQPDCIHRRAVAIDAAPDGGEGETAVTRDGIGLGVCGREMRSDVEQGVGRVEEDTCLSGSEY